MPDTLVLCGEAAATRDYETGALRLRLTGQGANIRLELADIERRMLANVKAQLANLTEIAAYIYCADQLVSRGGDASRGLGRDWRRQWQFVVPVRLPELWNDDVVATALRQTLGFMADEDFRFEFIAPAKPEPIDTYLAFAKSDSSIRADEVALFSGGLDHLQAPRTA